MSLKIRPIKTERDYERALKEIEELMDARANTLEGDRLDVLARLAETWEEEHHAIEEADAE